MCIDSQKVEETQNRKIKFLKDLCAKTVCVAFTKSQDSTDIFKMTKVRMLFKVLKLWRIFHRRLVKIDEHQVTFRNGLLLLLHRSRNLIESCLLCRIEITEASETNSDRHLPDQSDDENPPDVPVGPRPRRLSQLNLKNDHAPMPRASSFFVFAPTNPWVIHLPWFSDLSFTRICFRSNVNSRCSASCTPQRGGAWISRERVLICRSNSVCCYWSKGPIFLCLHMFCF